MSELFSQRSVLRVTELGSALCPFDIWRRASFVRTFTELGPSRLAWRLPSQSERGLTGVIRGMGGGMTMSEVGTIIVAALATLVTVFLFHPTS